MGNIFKIPDTSNDNNIDIADTLDRYIVSGNICDGTSAAGSIDTVGAGAPGTGGIVEHNLIDTNTSLRTGGGGFPSDDHNASKVLVHL